LHRHDLSIRVGLLDPLDQADRGLRLELGLGRTTTLRPKLLSHFRIQKLAFSRANTVAVALLADGVQLCASTGRLVCARGLALCTSPVLGCATRPAEALAPITRRADPYLAPAAHARRQSPGLLGGQSPAEVRRFLDD
jgi:hypothetical protein